MGTTPIPPGYGIASIKWQQILGARVESVTWGFKSDDAAGPNTHATKIATHWVANFPAAGLADTWEIAESYVLQNDGGVFSSAIHNINVTGTRTTASPPPAACARVTKTTLRAGKKYRGRVYLPNPMMEESTISSGGTLSSGAVASLQSAIDGFRNDMNADSMPLYLLHRDLSAPNIIIATVVRNSLGTQRRRQQIS